MSDIPDIPQNVPTDVPQKEAEIVHPEVALSQLMHDYKTNMQAKETALAEIHKEMEALTSRRNVLALPYEVTQEDLYGKIEALALDRGTKLVERDDKAKTAFICESGKITYFRAGIKRSWELDPLDRVCNSDPYVKERIWCFRNEAPILPRITLKVE